MTLASTRPGECADRQLADFIVFYRPRLMKSYCDLVGGRDEPWSPVVRAGLTELKRLWIACGQQQAQSKGSDVKYRLSCLANLLALMLMASLAGGGSSGRCRHLLCRSDDRQRQQQWHQCRIALEKRSGDEFVRGLRNPCGGRYGLFQQRGDVARHRNAGHLSHRRRHLHRKPLGHRHPRKAQGQRRYCLCGRSLQGSSDIPDRLPGIRGRRQQQGRQRHRDESLVLCGAAHRRDEARGRRHRPPRLEQHVARPVQVRNHRQQSRRHRGRSGQRRNPQFRHSRHVARCLADLSRRRKCQLHRQERYWCEATLSTTPGRIPATAPVPESSSRAG